MKQYLPKHPSNSRPQNFQRSTIGYLSNSWDSVSMIARMPVLTL